MMMGNTRKRFDKNTWQSSEIGADNFKNCWFLYFPCSNKVQCLFSILQLFSPWINRWLVSEDDGKKFRGAHINMDLWIIEALKSSPDMMSGWIALVCRVELLKEELIYLVTSRIISSKTGSWSEICYNIGNGNDGICGCFLKTLSWRISPFEVDAPICQTLFACKLRWYAVSGEMWKLRIIRE